MKRLSKVLFALAVILLIALPLSAAKSMNVTWSWLLNDPYVTSYRYQLDGESEDGWTVVDGTTSSYQATGLDPYKDYTLYLQCTYDGKIWSDSATSTAYALLQVEEIVEDLPVIEEVAPVEAETASFTLFGYTVENSWLDGVFTSTLKEKGIVTEDDVRGFALSEVEKYREMLTANTAISFVPDGFTLTYPEAVDPADYIEVYKADLEAYITSLFASEEAPEVEEVPVEEAVEETEEEMDIETSDFDVFGYRVLNSWYEGVFVSQTEEFGLVSEDDVIGFAEYEAEKYGELLTSNCYVYIVPDGFILLYPETLDIAPYIGIYKSDLEEYITFLFAAAEEPAVEETVEELPVVEEPQAEETVAVAPEAEVTEKEEVRVPEPVGEILVSVVTDKARVETENAPEAVKKLSTFSVSTSLGAEFGFKTGREYVTVFPRLDIAGEFRNVFSFGPVEIGARFDIASVFRPLDGTFLGHDFSYFLVGDNWAMDGTVDAKLMFSISSSSLRGYAGIGIGYSIASNVSGITSHTEPKVFGFNSAVVATGVLGLEWRISDAFSLSLEGQARYFMETKEYAVGAALRMGWNF